MEWTMEKIRLQLKYTWKISRNASEYKENFIIACHGNGISGKGEVAPNIRYAETPENIESAFRQIQNELTQAPEEPAAFETFIRKSTLPNALKFGIESAFIHWHCLAHQIPLHTFLGIDKPDSVATCYTLPIMHPAEMEAFYTKHQLKRFQHLKVKVNDAEALEMIRELNRLGIHQIMIDANEAWKDVEELIRFLPKLKPYPVLFVEQPMPASFKEEYLYLKPKSPLPIMADESVLDQPDFDLLEKQFHGINMKLMKAGSYINGIRILQETKKRNLIPMIGCMVETTLGIKSAWNLCSLASYADLDGCLIIDQEPFQLLEEKEGRFYEKTS